MDFDSYLYYGLQSSTATCDRATGKSNSGKFTTIAESDSHSEIVTRLLKEAVNFINMHPDSVVDMMEDSITIWYDYNEPVPKYQFFTVFKNKP